MIAYPVTIEPYTDEGRAVFVAKFTDFEARYSLIGDEKSDALGRAAEVLQWELIDRYLAGLPMPVSSPVPEGGIGIVAQFTWR
jgi:hypothetical protein